MDLFSFNKIIKIGYSQLNIKVNATYFSKDELFDSFLKKFEQNYIEQKKILTAEAMGTEEMKSIIALYGEKEAFRRRLIAEMMLPILNDKFDTISKSIKLPIKLKKIFYETIVLNEIRIIIYNIFG